VAQAFRARIAAIARKEAKKPGKACGRNKAGTIGYFRSCHGNNGRPEYWCADFARWVWWQAGAVNTAPDTHTLNALAASFANYGPVRRRNPKVGDAVLFHDDDGGIHHVAIVVRVLSGGRIRSIGGDEGGIGHGQAVFARTSYVKRDGPYDSAYGSYAAPIGMHISGFVSPVEDDMPYTRKQIRRYAGQGVANELKTDTATRDEIKGLVKQGVALELKNDTATRDEIKGLVAQGVADELRVAIAPGGLLAGIVQQVSEIHDHVIPPHPTETRPTPR
jgi:hypothetical protein